jgi:hypothetical protein
MFRIHDWDAHNDDDLIGQGSAAFYGLPWMTGRSRYWPGPGLGHVHRLWFVSFWAKRLMF